MKKDTSWSAAIFISYILSSHARDVSRDVRVWTHDSGRTLDIIHSQLQGNRP